MLIHLPSCDTANEEINREEWLKKNMIELNTINPDISDISGFSLMALKVKIGNAVIVGLGEQTHGTHEFWKIRHKVTRFLIEEMGFTAVLNESTFPGALSVHEWIQTGEGNLSDILNKYGIWPCEELVALITWMREYNEQLTDGEKNRKVTFLGYDCINSTRKPTIERLETYLNKVEPGVTTELIDRIKNDDKAGAVYVREFLESKQDEYIAISGQRQFEIIKRCVLTLIAAWNYFLDDNNSRGLNDRDAFNITNVQWIKNFFLNNQKIIIWAHNGHVSKEIYRKGTPYAIKFLGYHLNAAYGDLYYPVATSFYKGDFTAVYKCENSPEYGKFKVFSSDIPDDQTYSHFFNLTDIPYFFLDLKAVDYSKNSTKWLYGPLNFRMIGASYCDEYPESYYHMRTLPDFYDAVLYLKESTPLRWLESLNARNKFYFNSKFFP